MSVPLIKELERRLNRRQDKLNQSEAQNKDLRQHLEALELVRGALHPDYAKVMADITHAAYYGVRRPVDLGTARGHPESQSPFYDPAAYQLLKDVQRDQAVAATQLRKQLSKIVDGQSPPKEEE